MLRSKKEAVCYCKMWIQKFFYSIKTGFCHKAKILQKGGTMSKKKEKQYTVVAIGKPSIESLTDTEARVFYKSILSCILEKQIDSKKESEEN